MFGGRTEKYENAADLFTQAANAFRVQKQSWSHEASYASTIWSLETLTRAYRQGGWHGV